MLGSQGYEEIAPGGRLLSMGRNAMGGREMPRRRRGNHQCGGAVSDFPPLDHLDPEWARHAVLELVLALHPQRHLTIPALVSSMLDLPECGGAELERAVRDCVGEGFLWLKRGHLWPTLLALESKGGRLMGLTPLCGESPETAGCLKSQASVEFRNVLTARVSHYIDAFPN